MLLKENKRKKKERVVIDLRKSTFTRDEMFRILALMNYYKEKSERR